VGNDDQDVCVSGYDAWRAAIEYFECEKEVQAQLGNLWHAKKSVVKEFGLFYEEYSRPGWKEKEALACNALACAYLAPNVRVAKVYISSQSHRFASKWAWRELCRLATFWGAEFFDVETELQISKEIGGWLDTRSLGLKTTLRDLDRLLNDGYSVGRINYALEVSRRTITGPRPEYSNPGLVTNDRYQGEAKKSHPRVQMLTLTDEDLTKYYSKLTSFQRNPERKYAKLIPKHVNVVKDRISLYRKILLSYSRWYAIPDSLIDEDQAIDGYDLIPLNPLLEREFPIDDIEDYLLHQGEELPDLTWDPEIPDSVMLYEEVHASVKEFIACAQFSNYGVLPALEWLRRWGTSPNPKRIIDIDIIPIFPREHAPGRVIRLSRWKPQPENEDDFDADGYITVIGGAGGNKTMEEILREDFPDAIKAASPKPAPKVRTKEEEEKALDKLLSMRVGLDELSARGIIRNEPIPDYVSEEEFEFEEGLF